MGKDTTDDGDPRKPKPQNKAQKQKASDVAKKRAQRRWVIQVFIIAFTCSALLGFGSERIMSSLTSIVMPICIILFIVLVGIVFDIVGTAVTAVEEVAFLSMASRKIDGAREALSLIKNANKVASICNDIIGDICGIISGAAGGVLVIKLLSNSSGDDVILGAVVSGVIAAFTIGGKALGKQFAMQSSKEIVFFVGTTIARLKRAFRFIASPFRKRDGRASQ